MSCQRHWSVARVVLGHPGEEELEVSVLLLPGRVLVGLPGTVDAVGGAPFPSWIQEDEKRLELQRNFDQVAVAAFQHPTWVTCTELRDVGFGKSA